MPAHSETKVAEPAGPAVSPGARQSYRLVAYMWVAYFLNYCDRQVIFSIFPVLKTELGFTYIQLGLTGSVFLWVYGLCSPIAGQLGDRYSKRILVVTSLVLWSAITVLTGFSTTAVMLLVLRAGMGISEALFMPSAVALTANAFAPTRRSRALAILTTAQIAGVVAGGWFGGYFADQGHWRYGFFILGILGIVYSVPCYLFLRTVPEDAGVETKQGGSLWAIVNLARIPSYLILCFVFASFTFGLWLLYGWLPTFFYEKFSFGLAEAAFTATAYLQGATLVGMLGGGTLADWLYRRTKGARFLLIAAGLLGAAPCLYFLGNSDSLGLTRFAAVTFGLSSGVVIANLMASSFEIVPADTRASAVGFLNLFGCLVSGFATLSGGVWKQSLGMNHLLSLTALIYIAAGVLLLMGMRRFFRRDYERVH